MLLKVKVHSPIYSIHLSKNNNLNHSLQGGTVQNKTKEISNSSFCMEYAMNYLSFVRLKDISTLEFKSQNSTPGLSNSDFSTINFSTPDLSTMNF